MSPQTTRRTPRIAAALLSLLATLPLAAPTLAGGTPECTLAGSSIPADAQKCIAEFIAMLNQPTPEKVKAFEDQFGSDQRRKSAGAAERARNLAQGHEERGDVKFTRIGPASPGVTTIIVSTSGGEELAFQFYFSDSQPGKLDAVMISPASKMLVTKPVDHAAIAAIVEGTAKALESEYVYPEVAARMATLIRDNLAKGGYDAIKDEVALDMRLTNDLRSISHDKHLAVRMEPKRDDGHPDGPSAEAIAGDNYAFRKAEVLPGNIGYLRFDAFLDSPDAMTKASQAIGFVENSRALIIDLRNNGGGSPEMIRYITSYFFDSRTHLNDMVDRNGKVVEEYWTLDSVPGKRLGSDIPIFVLTSPRTFSGAEEFSYNLKNLKRATIVGETTGGGAHPVKGVRLTDTVVIGVPFMRAQNPISKANWEGTGVEPDVKVAADEALAKVVDLAKQAIKGQPTAVR